MTTLLPYGARRGGIQRFYQAFYNLSVHNLPRTRAAHSDALPFRYTAGQNSVIIHQEKSGVAQPTLLQRSVEIPFELYRRLEANGKEGTRRLREVTGCRTKWGNVKLDQPVSIILRSHYSRSIEAGVKYLTSLIEGGQMATDSPSHRPQQKQTGSVDIPYHVWRKLLENERAGFRRIRAFTKSSLSWGNVQNEDPVTISIRAVTEESVRMAKDYLNAMAEKISETAESTLPEELPTQQVDDTPSDAHDMNHDDHLKTSPLDPPSEGIIPHAGPSASGPQAIDVDVSQKPAWGVAWPPSEASKATSPTESSSSRGHRPPARAQQDSEIIAAKLALRQQDFKHVMRCVPHPVALLLCKLSDIPGQHSEPDKVDRHRGVTVSSLTAVTLDPEIIVSFNIKKPSRTLDAIMDLNRFSIQILESNSLGAAIANLFAKPYVDPAEPARKLSKMKDVRLVAMLNGTRHIRGPGVLAQLSCKVVRNKQIEIGDHVIVVAKVVQINFGQSLQALGSESAEEQAAATALSYVQRSYRGAGNIIEPFSEILEGESEAQSPVESVGDSNEATERYFNSAERYEDPGENQDELGNAYASDSARNPEKPPQLHGNDEQSLDPAQGDPILDNDIASNTSDTSAPSTASSPPTIQTRQYSTMRRPIAHTTKCSLITTSQRTIFTSPDPPTKYYNSTGSSTQPASQTSRSETSSIFETYAEDSTPADSLKQTVASFLSTDKPAPKRPMLRIKIRELEDAGVERIKLALKQPENGLVKPQDQRIRNLLVQLHAAVRAGQLEEEVLARILLGPDFDKKSSVEEEREEDQGRKGEETGYKQAFDGFGSNV